MSAANVLKYIKEKDAEFVDLRFTDPRGKLQHLTMDTSVVDEGMLKEGVLFDGSSIAGWKAINESDMILKPDTARMFMDPFTSHNTVVLFCDILDSIKNKVRVVNDPSSIRSISEKLYSAKYQKFMPSTIFTQNINEIKKFFRKNKKVILKPINSYSGNNIHLLKKFDVKLIKKFIKKHDYIICQKYLPKIIYGDKRVFLINGKIVGAISRVPKKGSFLSNMSKGAKPINTKMTTEERKISKLVANDLKKVNIFFAGIDFIDQKLNGDINVTSPTGLKTYYDLTNINLAKTFWKELKA